MVITIPYYAGSMQGGFRSFLIIKSGYNTLMNDTKKAAGKTFTANDVEKIAQLANIPVSPELATDLADGFTKTLKVVDQLNSVDVTGVEPTNQVTGLENVLREDEIDASRMFTQEEALAQGKRTYNGFFVVDQVLED